MREVFLLGVGHGTPLFIELAEACGYKVGGLYHYNDTRTGEIDHGFDILGSFEDLFQSDIEGKKFVLTMGDMSIKKSISDRILNSGGILPSLIHPSSIISRFANISDNGVLIASQCEVHSDAIIKEGCVLWPNVTIEHNSTLSSYTFCGPKAYIGAYTNVGYQAFIGQCSVIISGKAVSIGDHAVIGAAAVVTKPVLENTTVLGNPARILVTL